MDVTMMLMILKNLRGIGNARARLVLEAVDSIMDLQSLLDSLNRVLPGKGYGMDEVETAALLAAADQGQALELGVRILSCKDPGFPHRLLAATRPPVLLYCKGSHAPLQNDPAIAVIGSRTPGATGLDLAEAYAGLMASEGILVVSGLARGIDASAHRGCMNAGGRTAAFLAHGLGQPVFPAENKGLAAEIVSTGGVLLSEYPCPKPPEARCFIERDRLQSGLSDAVLLVESEIEGGAMHACWDALKLGKPLAVCTLDPMPGGNRRLLEAGAFPVRDQQGLMDLIKWLGSKLEKPLFGG